MFGHWKRTEKHRKMIKRSHVCIDRGFAAWTHFNEKHTFPFSTRTETEKTLAGGRGQKINWTKNLEKKNEKSRMELICVCRHYLDSDWIRTRMCMCMYVCVFACFLFRLCVLASVPSANIKILEMFLKKRFNVISQSIPLYRLSNNVRFPYNFLLFFVGVGCALSKFCQSDSQTEIQVKKLTTVSYSMLDILHRFATTNMNISLYFLYACMCSGGWDG